MDKRRKEYNEYLKSPAWKLLRQDVFDRDGGRCTKCGCKPSRGNWLEAHHTTYVNFGNEPLEDLLTLCRKCHVKHHRKERKKKPRKRSKQKKNNKQKRDPFRVSTIKINPDKETYTRRVVDGYEISITEMRWYNATPKKQKKSKGKDKLLYQCFCVERPHLVLQHEYEGVCIKELISRLDSIS